MDKISDFIKELKIRVSNPLMSSFIISWCCWNWRIVIGLIRLSPETLKTSGYNSYFDLVTQTSSFTQSFLWPFLCALIYTTVIPFVRMGIIGLNAWVDKRTGRWTKRITENGYVSVPEYLRMFQKLKASEEVLLSAVSSETNYSKKNAELTTALTQTQAQLQARDTDLETWQERTSVDFLNGRWKVTLLPDRFEYQDQYADRNLGIWQIINGKILVEKAGENDKVKAARIVNVRKSDLNDQFSGTIICPDRNLIFNQYASFADMYISVVDTNLVFQGQFDRNQVRMERIDGKGEIFSVLQA